MDGGPTFLYGDMFQSAWNQPGTLFVVTTNSTINQRRELVMGRGAAKQLTLHANGIAKVFGEVLAQYHMNLYGLAVFTRQMLEQKIGHWCRIFCDVGLFQVKTRYNDRADPDIIRHSAAQLLEYAVKNPNLQINMNMPGTGCGRLAEGVVMPHLKQLPKNVNIWRFAHEKPRATTPGETDAANAAN